MKFTESDELAGHWNEYYSTTIGELVNFFIFSFTYICFSVKRFMYFGFIELWHLFFVE